MRKLYYLLMTLGTTMTMIGCGGDKAEQAGQAAKTVVESVPRGGPGYFFMLIFVVVPVIVVLVKLFRESEATSDSLISLEGQLRRLNNKIDDLEAGLKGEKKGE